MAPAMAQTNIVGVRCENAICRSPHRQKSKEHAKRKNFRFFPKFPATVYHTVNFVDIIPEKQAAFLFFRLLIVRAKSTGAEHCSARILMRTFCRAGFCGVSRSVAQSVQIAREHARRTHDAKDKRHH
jgi:hypothetical protein